MPKEKQQTFLGATATLGIAVILVKLIGAIYKIPLGNIIGRDGMTHFNAAYKIYAVLLSLSTAGLPVALSKLVAESRALGKYNQSRRLLRASLRLFTAIGLAGTAVMFFFTRQLAAMMHNSLAYWPIKALSFSVLCCCIMSAFRGYTQGCENMVPSAVSQVIEAVFKLAAGLALAWYLISAGAGVEIGAAGAIAGVTISSALGLLYMVYDYLRTRGNTPRGSDRPASNGVLLRRILTIGIPITIGASGMSIITLVDQSLIMGRLQSVLGLTEEAAALLNGEYEFGMTLFNLPSSFVPPITMSLIPAVSAALTRRDHKRVGKIINTSLRLTTLLAFPAGVGLSVLAGPILTLLYPKQPEAALAATYHLQILGVASVFVCIMLLTNAILQAYGLAQIPIGTMFIGGIVKVVANFFLVGNPEINIKGAPVGTILCYIVIAVLNLIVVGLVMAKRPGYMQLFLKPAVATAAMAVTAKFGYRLLSGLGNSLATLGAIAAAALVYLILVLALRIITREDLELLPHGDRLARILRVR